LPPAPLVAGGKIEKANFSAGPKCFATRERAWRKPCQKSSTSKSALAVSLVRGSHQTRRPACSEEGLFPALTPAVVSCFIDFRWLRAQIRTLTFGQARSAEGFHISRKSVSVVGASVNTAFQYGVRMEWSGSGFVLMPMPGHKLKSEPVFDERHQKMALNTKFKSLSFRRYPRYEIWLIEFLAPVIVQSHQVLRENGLLARFL
jgi:hypothetical protein